MKKKNNKNIKHRFKKTIDFFQNESNQRVIGFILILFGIFCFISFTSFFFNYRDDLDLAEKGPKYLFENSELIKNHLGVLGVILSHFFIYLGFGISSYVIPFFSIITGLSLLGKKIYPIKSFLFDSVWVLSIVPIIIFHFLELQVYSGSIGTTITLLLYSLIAEIGTTLLIIAILLIYSTIRFKLTKNKINSILDRLKPKNDTIINISKKNENLPTKDNQQTNDLKKENNLKDDTADKEETIDNDIKIKISSQIEEKTTEINKNSLTKYDPTLELSSYKFPISDLLKKHGSGEINIDKSELEENKQSIVDTLGNYNIGIDSITATIGPTITLYEIVPEAGIRISKIKNLEDDIALSLSAEGIRIIAPIPGRGTIGIEVPNKKPTTVSMHTVLQSEKFQESNMDLPIALGKTISNETYILDLAKMPHLLMAGATGQGKSVGLNAILTSLLYKKHPAEIKFVLVDPKKVELTLFNKIERHFLAKLPDSEEAIITDTKKVVNTVNSLCIEMDQRYELLKNGMCRNIKEYNLKFISRKLNPENGHRFLPYIVLVIDEFADLIMTAGKEIETPIARLAQLARAIGIHLIIATQRPSVNVITGIIKANFPARAAFRVTSRIDSRTILDSGGADQLIGKGDMLVSTGSELIRLQCAFIDTPEVEKICEYIGSQRAYPSAYLLPEYLDEKNSNSSEIDLNERDALFDDAARLVVKHQSGSTSAIQRRMKIGYNRAGRIIDELEYAGIVGPFEGSKARQVLIKNEIELEELLKKI
ncbi:MAG: cell division protein FtsK [Flavobacteriales bacterium]|nr:cell division protein FtsK [Flavobacteriales bacterium]